MTCISRRHLVGGLCGLASLPLSNRLLAAPAPGLIDVHHHFFPPDFIAVGKNFTSRAASDPIRAQAWAPAVTPRILDWSPTASIETMDRNGIATSILSITTPGTWTGDRDESRKLSRKSNEYAANMVRDYPGRFGFFATIPLPDIDGSLSEIAYALDVLKADGICLVSSYDDKWPGDPVFAPVFDELNRRRAIVYSHPTVAPCCAGLQPGVSIAAVEFVFDTTRAIVSYLFNGTFTRCPDIKFIFSHGGGTLPMVAGRITQIANGQKEVMARLPRGSMAELQRLNFDTANVTNPSAMAGLLKLVPATQVMFGTDYPYLPIDPSVTQLDELGLNADDMRLIHHETAHRLMPRWG